MVIIYAFVKEFRKLKNIGFSFSPYYNFLYNPETTELTFSKNKDFPSNFFGDHIYSITANVGNNGTGKSSIIFWLLQLLNSRTQNKQVLNGFVVFQKSSGDFFIFNPGNLSISQYYSNIPILSFKQCWNIVNQPVVYYTGHFSVSPGLYLLNGKNLDLINISDLRLIQEDIKKYKYVNTGQDNSLRDFFRAFEVRNSHRIAQLLTDNHLRDVLGKMMNIPKYIEIKPNKSGYDNFTNNKNVWPSKFKLGLSPVNPEEKAKEKYSEETADYKRLRFIYSFIGYIFINLIDRFCEDCELYVIVYKKWLRFPTHKDLLGSLEMLIPFVNNLPLDKMYRIKKRDFKPESFKNLKNKKESLVGQQRKLHFILSTAIYTLINMQTEWNFQEGQRQNFFYLPVEDSQLLGKISEDLFRNHSYLSGIFFNITYRLDLNTTSYLSSGEMEMLNLLSRLYWSVKVAPEKTNNKEIPRIFFLDEAEIGFHPEWQKKYIHILKEFFDYVFSEFVRNGKRIQIIYTTHSPVTLSDMPKECVNFLQEKTIYNIDEKECPTDNTKVMNMRDTRQQTFGCNIFELYRDSFFMSNGLTGDFAQKYIKDIDNDIKTKLKIDSRLKENVDYHQEYRELGKRIELIGDRYIRNYLFKILNDEAKKNHKLLRDLIRQKRKEIEELEKELEKENDKD